MYTADYPKMLIAIALLTAAGGPPGAPEFSPLRHPRLADNDALSALDHIVTRHKRCPVVTPRRLVHSLTPGSGRRTRTNGIMVQSMWPGQPGAPTVQAASM